MNLMIYPFFHRESHMDHGFSEKQWIFIAKKYADRTAFFIDTFELPEELGTVTNELYGPSCGDKPLDEHETFEGKRGDRAWNSRLTLKPKRPTRFVRVIAGPHEEQCTLCKGRGTLVSDFPYGPGSSMNVEETCGRCQGAKTLKHACILYTAYGVHSLDAPQSPREPGDIRRQIAELEAKRRETYKTLEAEYRAAFGTAPVEEARFAEQQAMLDRHDEVRSALYKQLSDLRIERAKSDIFWSQHALAAPLSYMPCTDCGAPRMGDAVYDGGGYEDDPRRCKSCGTL